MRYVLRALGSQDLVEIDQSTFEAARVAKDSLVVMIGVEQKFDLLFENYIDYERELIDRTINRAFRHDHAWGGYQDDIAAVSRRLANVLSAARLYVDHLSHDLRVALGELSSVPDQVETAKSAEYDARLGYRLMESLRNVTQHNMLPIYSMSYPHDSPGEGMRVRAVPLIEVARLPTSKIKKPIRDELEAGPPSLKLTPLLRDYLEGLGRVHEFLRTATAWQVAIWDGTLATVQAQGAEASGPDRRKAVLALALDDDDDVIEQVQIFLDLTDYRQSFERRNSLLTNLSKRYVSTEG